MRRGGHCAAKASRAPGNGCEIPFAPAIGDRPRCTQLQLVQIRAERIPLRRGADVAAKVDSFRMSDVSGRNAKEMHKVHARITAFFRGAQPPLSGPVIHNSGSGPAARSGKRAAHPDEPEKAETSGQHEDRRGLWSRGYRIHHDVVQSGQTDAICGVIVERERKWSSPSL